jgi:hypothetical protein
MNYYFGDRYNVANPPLWAEIALPGWILDGGFPALVLYLIALGLTAWHDLRLCKTASLRGDLSLASTVAAGNAGAYALMFSYAVFTSQIGMQFWFLAGVLHGVYGPVPRRKPRVAEKPAWSPSRS